jgi:beta-N-acetylhexosaminidase
MAVAKHFPGLGGASRDPHYHLPVILADTKEMEEVNLPPFETAIRAGAAGLMTSHAVYPALEPDLPATMSSIILQDLLRGRLGFEGLLVTDDLEMGAIAKKWGAAEGAAAAFEAGADVLLICHGQENVRAAMKQIRQKLLHNRIPMTRLHQSVSRIMRVKSRFLAHAKGVSMEAVGDHFGLK